MKKNNLNIIGFSLILFFILFLTASASSTSTPCSTDSDCKKLDYTVTFQPEEQICYDKIKYFTGQESIFYSYSEYNTGNMRNLNFLIGKKYTDYLQLGYKVEHKCGSNGYCEISKKNPYTEGQYKKCGYGCLVTPTYYKKEFEEEGKTYSNFCICDEGRVRDTEAFCDYERGNDAYFWFNAWICEKEVRTGMICGKGGMCGTRNGTIGCWPETNSVSTSSKSKETQYALTIPSMNQPIKVVALKNGKIIGEKPISNLSAEEYYKTHGKINASPSQAAYYAQKTGLTTIANAYANNAGRASTTTNSRPSTSYSGEISSIGTSFLKNSINASPANYYTNTAYSYYPRNTGTSTSSWVAKHTNTGTQANTTTSTPRATYTNAHNLYTRNTLSRAHAAYSTNRTGIGTTATTQSNNSNTWVQNALNNKKTTTATTVKKSAPVYKKYARTTQAKTSASTTNYKHYANTLTKYTR